MSAAARGSTDTVPVCVRAPAERSSGGAAAKDASGSPRRGRPFVSLRSRSDIRRVRRDGSRRRAGGVVGFGAPGVDGPPRVAVIAGKQVGGAVERNRAKRRLREAAARVPLRHGRDYLLIAGPAVGEARFESLIDWVRAAVEVEEQT